MSIKSRFQTIRQRTPDHVRIVLACKTRSPEEVLEVIDAGATDIGHNYVQEAEEMHDALQSKNLDINWHMIGHLQTNKINKILPICNTIQTIDSVKKATALQTRAKQQNVKINAYLEINSAEEQNKAGLPPHLDAIDPIIAEITKMDHINLTGLMTMGPFTDNPENIRPYFKKTKQLFDQLKKEICPTLNTLSMGMSDSYQIAIEEGSTMIRLGSVIFGSRRN